MTEKIRWVLTDVDGVLTDGCVYYSADGEELLKFNRRDGMGFELLHKHGLKTALVTKENNPIVRRRADKLGIGTVLEGIDDKAAAVKAFLADKSVSLEQVAYIGDDINDLELLGTAGFSAAPADATEDNRKQVHFVCKQEGGQGAFREFAEEILKRQR